MPRPDEPTTAGLAVNYTNIAIAMSEAAKGSTDPSVVESFARSIKGLCGLVDALVSKQHVESFGAGRLSS